MEDSWQREDSNVENCPLTLKLFFYDVSCKFVFFDHRAGPGKCPLTQPDVCVLGSVCPREQHRGTPRPQWLRGGRAERAACAVPQLPKQIGKVDSLGFRDLALIQTPLNCSDQGRSDRLSNLLISRQPPKNGRNEIPCKSF